MYYDVGDVEDYFKTSGIISKLSLKNILLKHIK